MSAWEALLLGFIQGVTEFLPVSSSGHLIIAQHLLGFQDLKSYIFFDLLCHLGTLGAIFVIFYDDIKQTLKSSKKSLLFVTALLPLCLLSPFLKPIKAIFYQPELLGYCFLITSAILFLGHFYQKTPKAYSMRSALLVGVSQVLAIVPGISRSGTTITTGRLLGWPPYQAICFSFLLSIPTILGGLMLESYHLIHQKQDLPDISMTTYFIGCLSAFLFGLFALKLLIRIVEKGKFQLFAWYCLALGIFTIYLF